MRKFRSHRHLLVSCLLLGGMCVRGPDAADPLPGPEERSAALAGLRATYRGTLQDGPERRIDFAMLQLDRAADARMEAVEAAARLVLSAEIGQSVDRVDVVLRASAAIQARFGSAPTAELRRTWLAPMTSQVGRAACTLLDHPDDPAANEILGTFYFQKVQDEQQAFAYWARGTGRRKQIALLEKDGGPADSAGAADLGDLWYEEGRSSPAALRVVCFVRARASYRRALEGGNGAAAESVTSRLAEIAKVLPEEPKDWNRLSQAQWSLFKGEVRRIPPSKNPVPIGIQVKEGASVRVLPHPSDTWVVFSGGVPSNPTFHGMPPPVSVGSKFQGKPPAFGAMLLWADGKPIRPGEVVTGPASLACSVEMLGVDAENTVKLGGEGIRIKVVAVAGEAK